MTRRSPIAALPGLTDQQLRCLMEAAQPLPAEKRAVLVQRLGGLLRQAGEVSDRQFALALKAAMRGLVQKPAEEHLTRVGGAFSLLFP
jgi:hypothetical protein